MAEDLTFGGHEGETYWNGKWVKIQNGAPVGVTPEESAQYAKDVSEATKWRNRVGVAMPDDLGAGTVYAPGDAGAHQDSYNHRNDPTAFGALRDQGTTYNLASQGWSPHADLNFYDTNGDPNFEKNQTTRMFANADAAAGRTGPTINTSAVDPLTGKAVGAGDTVMGLSGELAALGRMPAGPSAAELAMGRTAGQAQNAQASLAAGVRGGNSGLALGNAGANMAQIGGQLTQDIGIQRAAEDMANRNFAANALTGAAGVAGQGAGIYGQSAGLNANIAGQNATLEAGQRALNDQTGFGYNREGLAIAQSGTANKMEYDKRRTDAYLSLRNNEYNNRDRTGEGTITGSAGGDKLLGAGLTTGGTLLAPSDIRDKTHIAPAAGEVDDTFRGLGQYGYDYKDPGAPGANSGRNFGPMAQELERTPAGASAVTTMPGGKKGIDTGRLALVNASETARLRQELDDLKAGAEQGRQIGGTRVGYPGQSRTVDLPMTTRDRLAQMPSSEPGLPPPGVMRGRAHLDSNIAPQVPPGAARPLAPGEYVRNPDGSWSSEVSTSVSSPKLNHGRATNIPSMWVKDGNPYIASGDDEAVDMATKSGLPFRSYGSLDEADRAAADRESAWQPIENPRDARRIEPLWDTGAKAERVQATPLVFSSEDGGNFRTPDEQLAFSRERGGNLVRRPPVEPTPLFYGADDTFRDPAEQYAYARSRGATNIPRETEASLSRMLRRPPASYASRGP